MNEFILALLLNHPHPVHSHLCHHTQDVHLGERLKLESQQIPRNFLRQLQQIDLLTLPIGTHTFHRLMLHLSLCSNSHNSRQLYPICQSVPTSSDSIIIIIPHGPTQGYKSSPKKDTVIKKPVKNGLTFSLSLVVTIVIIIDPHDYCNFNFR